MIRPPKIATAIAIVLGLAGITACGASQTVQTAPVAPPPRAAAPPPPPAARPEGLWLGTLEAGGLKLRLAFHIDKGPDGTLPDTALHATLDSLDQQLTGVPLDTARYTAGTLRLELNKLHASFEGTLSHTAAGDRLSGTFIQGARSVPLVMSRVDKIEPPRRPQEPQRPFPYREEDVKITVRATPLDPGHAEQITLAGTLTLPPGKGPFPAVVFITGSGPQDRDETLLGHKPFLLLSDALTRRGIATLRLDDRGVGGSGGNPAIATTLDFTEDVIAELGWLAARPEIDRRAIGVIGHSEGGLIGPMVAAKSDRARFVVMLAGPGMPGTQILLAQASLIARAKGTPEAQIERDRADAQALYDRLRTSTTDADAEAGVQAFVDADPAHKGDREAGAQRLRSTLPWFRAFLRLDPASYLAKVRVPVLAISGERDLQVPKDNLPIIEAALGRAHNRDITVQLIPGVNHLFQHTRTGSPSEYSTIEETFAPEAVQRIGDWIVERTTRLRSVVPRVVR